MSLDLLARALIPVEFLKWLEMIVALYAPAMLPFTRWQSVHMNGVVFLSGCVLSGTTVPVELWHAQQLAFIPYPDALLLFRFACVDLLKLPPSI
jgi:hypothetical protein